MLRHAWYCIKHKDMAKPRRCINTDRIAVNRKYQEYTALCGVMRQPDVPSVWLSRYTVDVFRVSRLTHEPLANLLPAAATED